RQVSKQAAQLLQCLAVAFRLNRPPATTKLLAISRSSGGGSSERHPCKSLQLCAFFVPAAGRARRRGGLGDGLGRWRPRNLCGGRQRRRRRGTRGHGGATERKSAMVARVCAED